MKWIKKLIPKNIRNTLGLRYFGFRHIPMLFFARPSVVEFSAEKVVVKIPLTRRTKNHLNAMYFGALSVGADCAGGLLAMQLARSSPERISLIFKDFHADFLRRAQGDVHFTCDQGRDISRLVEKAAESVERVEMPVSVTATVPGLESDPVALFRLTLSLRKRT